MKGRGNSGHGIPVDGIPATLIFILIILSESFRAEGIGLNGNRPCRNDSGGRGRTLSYRDTGGDRRLHWKGARILIGIGAAAALRARLT